MCIWKSVEAEETKEHNVKGQCGKGARREEKRIEGKRIKTHEGEERR